MADNLELAIKLISRNSSDMAAIVERMGGITGFLAAMPSILRLLRTVNDLNAEKPDDAVPLQYGLGTFAEVKAFQIKHGLSADGIIGDRTWLKIKQQLLVAGAGKS